MVKQVLLCGCGNIGFRHLQAISDINIEAHITIIEPFEGAHPRIIEHINSMTEKGAIQFTLLKQLPKSPHEYDLAVIATNADTRQSAFNDLLQTHSVKTIIFEKILFQSIAAIDKVRDELKANNISAYVNCGRRGFESYRAIKADLDNSVATNITVSGGAFGLASNAIHFLDLIEFLNDSELKNVDLAGLDPEPVESKRVGFYEVFGTLNAVLENGATLTVTCADSTDMSVKILIENRQDVVEIDELNGTQVKDGQATAFQVKHVSGMPYLYENALETGHSDLTPYLASARQHRFYLHSMCKYLKLPLQDDTICPIS